MRASTLLYALLLSLGAANSLAQTTPTGTISGRVLDPDGLPMSGTVVTVASVALQGTRSATSSDHGDYIIPFLPAGQYDLVFEQTGFASSRRAVRVQVAESVTLNLRMVLAGVSETIYFPRVPPVVESTPLRRKRPSPESVPPVAAASGQSRNTGVLVVEDDGSVRAFTCAVLRNAGYDAVGASTGEEAMALASTHSSPLDLIMTDVALPGISGADLVRQLLRMRPQARILYASGFSALALKSQGVIDEVGGFLQKPFTRHQLLAAVQARLDDTDVGGAAFH